MCSSYSSLISSEYFEKVATGEICIGVNEWPAYMYGNNVEYNEDNDKEGLCRGPYSWWYVFIFVNVLDWLIYLNV